MNSALLSPRIIAAWTRSSRDCTEVDRSDDLVRRARDIWQRLKTSQPTGVCLSGDEALPDVGYALRELVLADSVAPAHVAIRAFDFLRGFDWPTNEFEEKPDVLSDIAYSISVRYRRERDYPNMRKWEQRCVSLLQESEPSATYLLNRQANGANKADRQFLSRPAVLLAVCRQLERDRNCRPLDATAQATSAFIATGDATMCPEELAYLRSELSHSAAVSECHIGNFEACSQWILTARSLCAQTSFPAAVLTCLAVTELMSKHSRHCFSETLEGIDSVLVQASALGIEKAVLTLRVLRAHTLKDLKRFDEAVVAFSEINAEKLTDDPLMRAVISVGLAETQQMLGDLRGAVESCRRASLLATQSDTALGWGMLHASVGQILLNSGQPDEGLRELDRSIEAYGSGGLVQLQTYIMITSAEILLRLGHRPEGIARLLGALAILRRTPVNHEIAVAVELLRAALRAGLPPSPQAVQELRQILGSLSRVN